jgi:hypothetical protein
VVHLPAGRKDENRAERETERMTDETERIETHGDPLEMEMGVLRIALRRKGRIDADG